MAFASIYILYAGITYTFNEIFLISIILMSAESATFLFYKWTCPLTPLAKKYTSDRSDNFDIYLPNWLAKHNKIIFGTILIIGLILVIFRLVVVGPVRFVD